MELRKPKLPAGTAALALVQRTMKPLVESGLILVIPTRSVVDSLKSDLVMVVASPFSYHPGARYLEVDTASLSTDMYKEFLADAGYYVKQNHLLKTIRTLWSDELLPEQTSSLTGLIKEEFKGLAEKVSGF